MRRAPRSLPCLGVVTSLAIALSLSLPREACADDPAATALIERGLDLRQAQKDQEALALFEAAEKIAHSPRGQAQVALAQQALGRWVPAERNLRAALATKEAWIESRRPILERALGVIATHLGDVEIVGAKGAVFVDGARIDGPDAISHLRLEVGRRMLEIRSEGLYPFSRTLEVTAGQVVHLEVEQHPLLESSPSSGDGHVDARSSGASGGSDGVGDPGKTQRLLGYIGVAGAGVFLAVGVGGLVERSAAVSDYNNSSTCRNAPANNQPAQCASWMSNGSTGSTVALVGFIGGGIVGALSIALLVTAPAKPKAIAFSLPVPVSCAPANGGAFCALAGTF